MKKIMDTGFKKLTETQYLMEELLNIVYYSEDNINITLRYL